MAGHVMSGHVRSGQLDRGQSCHVLTIQPSAVAIAADAFGQLRQKVHPCLCPFLRLSSGSQLPFLHAQLGQHFYALDCQRTGSQHQL